MRRERRGRRRGAGDVELLGLGEDGDSSGVLLDQVDLETLAGGPARGRCVHGGGTRGGGNVLLQINVDVRVHHHVYQGDCEAAGISRDRVPRDILSVLAGIPKGT